MNRTLVVGLIALAAASTALATSAPKRKGAPKPVAEAPLETASPEQLGAAEMVHYGDYACEFNQSVKVAINPKTPGYVDVLLGKRTWTMRPTLSSTGALRLEDVKAQTLMLQIAHKSMLMDVKAGQRLVDGCMHEKQVAAKKAYDDQGQQPSVMSN